MARYLQNLVAESHLTLPVMGLVTLVVWLLAGLVAEGWWWQLACFAVTTGLLFQMNTIHALIRIYSRMVSVIFLVLSCASCFLFPSLRGALFQLFLTAGISVLFTTYQDREASGRAYYAFLLLGLATLCYVRMFYLVPVVWVLMATQLMCLSWQTWSASLLGIITPYWFYASWLLWCDDFSPLSDHFSELAAVQWYADYTAIPSAHLVFFAFCLLLLAIGLGHYWRKSYADKIRTRLFYGFFIILNLITVVWLALQPQCYDMLFRLLVLSLSPLVAHFMTLTSTRVTNVTCIVLTVLAVLVIGFSLWTSSSLF